MPALARRVSCALAAGAFAFAAALLAPAVARADDVSEFETGKNRFDAGQYEEASKRFAGMLDEKVPTCASKPKPSPDASCRLTDPDLTERARALWAASLIALSKPAEADAQIERVLRANPSFAPSPATFPPDVLDRFSAVRGRLRKELEQLVIDKAEKERQARLTAQRASESERERLAQLERLATEVQVIDTRSRWLAFVPFGVGQFQNGRTGLGTFFLVSEALAGSTSLVLAGLWFKNITVDLDEPITNADGGQSFPNATELGVTTLRLEFANRVAFGAWAALTLAGVVEAQISFVPTRVITKKRKLPPTLRATPQVGYLPGGAYVGLGGRF